MGLTSRNGVTSKHTLGAGVPSGPATSLPRERPVPGQRGGFGLWVANQVCDLVQVRTYPSGNVVRLHMRRARRVPTA